MDWIATLGTLLSVHLVRKKKWQGFAVGLIAEAVWVYVAVTTHVYGLLVIAAFLFYTYSMAIMEWRADIRPSRRDSL